MNAVLPGIVWRDTRISARAPHYAAGLEACPEGKHPNPVSPPDPPLGLEVTQLVKNQTARRVSKPVEAHPSRFSDPIIEPHDAAHRVDHRLPASVNTHVLERGGEVRHLRRGGFPLTFSEGARHAVGVADEFGDGEDMRGKGGDVSAEACAGDADEVFGEGDADATVVVVGLHCSTVGCVFGPVVGAECSDKLVFGRSAARGITCEERCRCANAEDAVSDQHVTIVAEVPAGVCMFSSKKVSLFKILIILLYLAKNIISGSTVSAMLQFLN